MDEINISVEEYAIGYITSKAQGISLFPKKIDLGAGGGGRGMSLKATEQEGGREGEGKKQFSASSGAPSLGG